MSARRASGATRRPGLRSRVPPRTAELRGPVAQPVTIDWDSWGVPHVRARSERDVFVGLGYAMAQERLWQLDYMRRLARGELAAVFGSGALASDRAMRILGLARTAERDAQELESDEAVALAGLADGINLWLGRVERLPIELELLGYRPAPWRPADSIAIWKYRWWYNTGRLNETALAEIAGRTLTPRLFEAFSQGEAGDETIVPDSGGARAPGSAHAEGSNNWVAGPSKSATGKPVLCSDPHNPFGAPSQWFEAQLTTPDWDAIGAIYQGMPTVYIGRTRHAAWGVTNHVAPARDLYVEPEDEPLSSVEETIEVAGASAERLRVERSARGPIVRAGSGLLDDGLLRTLGSPTLSLRWVGHDPGTGIASGLGLMRARGEPEVLAALARWPCPPLNFVYACADGRFGYHVAGRVPRRAVGGRGLRPANDPAHAWDGEIGFDELPKLPNPERGWVATANNPPWATGTHDQRYLSLASWSDGYRMRAIRERLTARERLTVDEVAAAQADVASPRARELVPVVRQMLGGARDARIGRALARLARWDGRMTERSTAAGVWAAFWDAWCGEVARARFPREIARQIVGQVGGIARRLLEGDSLDWWTDDAPLTERVERALSEGLARLERLAGPEGKGWAWGKLHTVAWEHPLAGQMPGLSTGPFPTSGGFTVRAATYDLGGGSFAVTGGSTYRFVADFAEGAVPARSTINLGQSGHPGSRHYRDQTRLWLRDGYKPLWMDPRDVAGNLEGTTTLSP